MRRTKLIAKTARANMQEQTQIWSSGVPKQYTLLNGLYSLKVNLEEPVFREKCMFLEDSTSLPFVEIQFKDMKWLYNFIGEILERSENEAIPFLNSKLDYQNPGMSAFRIYSNDSFMQVQVRKLPESSKLFQLDYFEPTQSGRMVLKMVLICDVTEGASCVVYSSASNTTHEYAGKITSTFRDFTIFLRTWDYSQRGKLCTITPFPKLYSER